PVVQPVPNLAVRFIVGIRRCNQQAAEATAELVKRKMTQIAPPGYGPSGAAPAWCSSKSYQNRQRMNPVLRMPRTSGGWAATGLPIPCRNGGEFLEVVQLADISPVVSASVPVRFGLVSVVERFLSDSWTVGPFSTAIV